MAWNRNCEKQNLKHAVRSKCWIVVAGGLIVASIPIVVIGLFLVSENPESPTQSAKFEAPKPIKSTAHIFSSQSVVTQQMPRTQKKSNAGAKTYVDSRGIKRYEGGARVFDRPRREPVHLSEKKPLFHHYAENQILSLILTQPGSPIFVTRKYDKRFVESFQRSLEEPIIISKEDSENERLLKKTMNEVKSDLAQRIRNGEDLCTIMMETNLELQRLSQVKREIQQMAREMMKERPEMTEQEAQDLLNATNKMLEQKGIAPVRPSLILGKNFKLNYKAGEQK